MGVDLKRLIPLDYEPEFLDEEEEETVLPEAEPEPAAAPTPGPDEMVIPEPETYTLPREAKPGEVVKKGADVYTLPKIVDPNQPAEKPKQKPKLVPLDYEPEFLDEEEPKPKHGALVRGAVSGGVGAIEGAGEAAKVFNRKAGGSETSALGRLGALLGGVGEGGTGEYEREEPSFTDVESLGEFGTYVAESFASGLASTFPSLVGGAGGAVVGAPAGPYGAAAGAWAGAAVPSFISGVGGASQDLRADAGVQQALKEGKITEDQLDNYALGTGALIGSLDALGAGKLINLTGIGKQALRETARQSVLAAVKRGIVEGSLAEGGTEAAQQILTEGAQVFLGGNLDLADRVVRVIDSTLQGIITGGPVGGVGAGAAEIRKPKAGIEDEETVEEAGVSEGEPGVVIDEGAGQDTPGDLGATEPPPPAGAPPSATTPAPLSVTPGTPTIKPVAVVPAAGGPAVVQPGQVAPDIGAALPGAAPAALPTGTQAIPAPAEDLEEEIEEEGEEISGDIAASEQRIRDMFRDEVERERASQIAVPTPAGVDEAAALAAAKAQGVTPVTQETLGTGRALAASPTPAVMPPAAGVEARAGSC